LKLDFVMRLGRHAAGRAAEDHVRHTIHDAGALVIAIAGCQAGNDPKEASKDLQTVGAADQTHVIFIEAKVVSLSNDNAGSRRRQTRAHHGFQAHAGARADGFTHTALAKIALAAFVVGPARTRCNVIERAVSHIDLGGAETKDGAHPAAWCTAGSLTHGNVVLVAAVGKVAHHTAIASSLLIMRPEQRQHKQGVNARLV
jgi:hypothetical protein